MNAFKFSLVFCLLTMTSLSAHPSEFISGWVGHWEGKCYMTSFMGDSSFFPIDMTLSVSPGEEKSFGWVIKYGGEEARNYKLLQMDRPGHFVLDEGNGLQIDRFFKPSSYHEMYSVNMPLPGSTTYASRVYSTQAFLTGDQIVIQTQSFWSNNPRVTTIKDASGVQTTVASLGANDYTQCSLRRLPSQ